MSPHFPDALYGGERFSADCGGTTTLCQHYPQPKSQGYPVAQGTNTAGFHQPSSPFSYYFLE